MLSNYSFKTFYSTATDDIPEIFYNRALEETNYFDRVSGYFSSSSLAYYSKGIENLIKNNGKYRLIISHELSESDYLSILEGYKNKQDALANQLISRLYIDGLSDEQKRNFTNLAYLIEIGLVDIKIGFTKSGLFHAKFGLFRDLYDNIVYFSGSLNETEAAFRKNYEEITVLKSWESNYEELQQKTLYFEKLWNNSTNDNMLFVKSINEIIKSKIISFSQGKLIVDNIIFKENALILFYDSKLQIKNNLGQAIDLSQRAIKMIIKKGYADENFLQFNPNLKYKDVQEIIRLLERYSRRTETNFYVADSVKKFIENNEFKIQAVANRGLAIKNKDLIFQDSYKNFIDIVNQEVSRPLYEIQSWVSFYQATMQRVANFSVPGAGKTSMIYGTFAYLSSKQINKIDKIVVIGPKNSFISWKEEFKVVFGSKRELIVLDVHDSLFQEEMLYKNINSYNLFLVNYESLAKYQNALSNIVDSRTMIVFDEVHKIKRVESLRAQIAIDLAERTKYRYVLTGTPIPNSYQDIWNFLHILYNVEFDSYFDFNLASLCSPDNNQIIDINEKLSPFFWRVTKNELNVPKENEDVVLKIVANNVEQQLINLMWKKFSQSPFKLYIRLIQLASNPQLLKERISLDMYGDFSSDIEDLSINFIDEKPIFDENEIKLIDSIENSSKYIECINQAVKMTQESKIIIIWCIFIDTIKKLSDDLNDKGLRVAVIHGGIDNKERENIILDFQNGLYDVLVTNPHTLAESVSLHLIAHDAIYLEYSFNLTHMLQSRDRIHRLGLKENQETNYFYFMLEGQNGQRSTIDQKIYYKLLSKRDIMYEAIESPMVAPQFSINEKDEILEMMLEELDQKNI